MSIGNSRGPVEARPGIDRILMFRPADLSFASRAIRHLRSRFEGAEITMLLPSHQVEFLRDGAEPDRVCTYDRARDGALRAFLGVVTGLRKRRYDLVVVPAPDGNDLGDLRGALFLALLLRLGPQAVIDDRLELTRLSLRRRLALLIDWALSLPLLAVATAATRAILALFPAPSKHSLSPHGRVTPSPQPSPIGRGSRESTGSRPEDPLSPGGGEGKGEGGRGKGEGVRVAVLVPVLPDLSHTFVYREVLGMKENGGHFSLIALERGDPSIIHPEAGALLESARFAPRLSAIGYLAHYLYFLFTSPRRMASLIRLYLPNSGNDPLLFLRLGRDRNICHPMRALSLARLLKRLRITHIHAHGSTYPATRAMVSSVLLDATFSFSTFVDFDYESDFKLLGDKVRQAEFVVATTRFCVDRLVALTAEKYRSKIHTIHLGIDPDYGREDRAPAPDGAPTILSVCRFVEKKGLDYLLRACAILRQKGASFRCLLVGDGPERDRLVTLAEKLELAGLVEFTGPVSNATVRDLMTRGDLLVAPSVYAGDGERDGIPTVLLEAMAYAIPVISTRVSGIPELVAHEQNGLLVKERDEVALADAMQRLLREPQLRASLGRRGRERVLADFDIRHSSRRLWALIDRASRP